MPEGRAAATSFGGLLRQHRLASGLTQEVLAARAGLSAHGIQKLEHGVTRPYRATVQRLALALALSPADQVGFWAAGQPAPRRRHLRAPVAVAPKPAGRHNLPTPLTSLIGRERELTDVRARLSGARLLTLTGVGGCGKTRLALEVARTVNDDYPDGVWLVELGPLVDAALVPHTVAAVLNMRETPGHSIADALATALRPRRLLLVLDNCEHVLDACAQLADRLLRGCPELRILATSREALGLTGEIAWRVPSLPSPDPLHLPPFAELEQNAAVRLFVERAVAVQPQYVLTERNAPMVAQVCQRLDGIPLALELAAARVDGLTVDQLAARLNQRFRLLTGGSRTALPRQQTLRAAVDWSYDLLSGTERLMLNRLSVFAGGWTLEAVEAVCTDDGVALQDVLVVLLQLVRKSLVVAEENGDGAARYRLLETLRQYAHERLTVAADADRVRGWHARYYTELAEAVAAPGLKVGQWRTRLLTEHDNLRAAMRWLSECNAVQQAVRLGGILWPMWVWGGYLTEGRAHLRTLLALPEATSASSEWARLHWCGGYVEFFAGDYAEARARFEQALAVQRSLGDRLGLAGTLSYLGQAAREQGDYAAARIWLDESLALAQESGDARRCAEVLDRLGTIAHALGDFDLAQSRYEEGMVLREQAGDRVEQAWSRHNLGCLALDLGDYAAARSWLTQSLGLRVAQDHVGFVHALAEFAVLAAAEGLPVSAARLAGATIALTERTGIPIQPSERGRYERWLAAARQAAGEDIAVAAWVTGHDMPLEQAIEYALAPREPWTPPVASAAQPRLARTADQLTLRQREVAALVARGRSNRQIGESLVITERTVAAHIENMLNKLGYSSRTQIGVWAAERGLVTSTNA
jgi:predicted ATPase/DNA-binding CsgD family transcriptional regulator/Tfp pilus assembly protein PilF/DNA-binding XRE family transcriptional regulator